MENTKTTKKQTWLEAISIAFLAIFFGAPVMTFWLKVFHD